MKRHLLRTLTLGLVCALLLLAGCAQRTAGPENTCAEYLTCYFTSDDQGRYTKLSGSDYSGQDLAAYYETFRPVAAERCIEEMTQNRQPLSLEQALARAGLSGRPDGLQLTPYAEQEERSVYTFSLDLIVAAGDGAETRVPLTGQITVERAGGKVLHLYVEESEALLALIAA